MAKKKYSNGIGRVKHIPGGLCYGGFFFGLLTSVWGNITV